MRSTLPHTRLPSLIAFLVQISATFFIGVLAIITNLTFTLFEWSILQGVIAGFISYQIRMATWWIPIHLIFLPALIFILALEFSAIWYGFTFLVLLLIYGKTFKTQVPLYLSSKEVIPVIKTFLPSQTNFKFIDLGSGCGGLVNKLSKICSNGCYFGIEAAPLPVLISKIRNLFHAKKCKTYWGDFWQHDLSQYDVVYAYLSPVPMASLWEKACKEMRPGSLLISNTFNIPGVTPDKAIPLNDFSGSTLYLWRI